MATRVLCCSCFPHPWVHLDHCENSDTTQSRGHGMRHACSVGGRGAKCSQASFAAAVLFSFCTQRTARCCRPCCAVTHSAAWGLAWPRVRGASTQWCQSEASHWKRSLCQSQTRKQLLSFGGLLLSSQWERWLVQPSKWKHHSDRVWVPPGPQSPVHLPQGPTGRETRCRLLGDSVPPSAQNQGNLHTSQHSQCESINSGGRYNLVVKNVDSPSSVGP